MKIILTVADSNATRINNWFAARIASLADTDEKEDFEINVAYGSSDISFVADSIQVTDLPRFKVGDVVENTKSGNWGKIHSIDTDGTLVVHTSKKTFEETGAKVMNFHQDEADHLI